MIRNLDIKVPFIIYFFTAKYIIIYTVGWNAPLKASKKDPL